MIRVSNIKLPIDYNDSILKKAVAKELRADINSIEKIALFRRSIDARKKNDLRFIITADVYLKTNENKVLSRSRSKNAVIAKP